MSESKPLAVITGASSGIGAVFARALAARGYDLALVARRQDRLRQLGDELSNQFHVNCTLLQADLTCDAELHGVENFLAGAPHLQLLVNNAGFGTLGRFYEASIESQDAMHRVHVLATMRLTHAALGNLTARNQGAIINVASVAAFVPRPGSTSYYATKAWINCFTEGIYLELKSAGSRVRMQALCPGFTVTEFHDVSGLDRKVVPSGWWMSAEDVVEASLRGLEKGKLFVVPGWRYKLLVSLMRLLPRGVLHFALTKGPASLRRERKPSQPPPNSALPRN
jgi:short-subunit dehydrogenase